MGHWPSHPVLRTGMDLWAELALVPDLRGRDFLHQPRRSVGHPYGRKHILDDAILSGLNVKPTQNKEIPMSTINRPSFATRFICFGGAVFGGFCIYTSTFATEGDATYLLAFGLILTIPSVLGMIRGW